MDYETYEEVETYKKRSLIKRILIALIILIAVIGIILLIVFAIKGRKSETYINSNFEENIKLMKQASYNYFDSSNLPATEGEVVRLTLRQMVDKGLLVMLKDEKGNACSYSESYVEITKLKNEYQMKVSLNCGGQVDYLITYVGHYSYCTNYLCENKSTTAITSSSTNGTSIRTSSSSSRSISSSSSTSSSSGSRSISSSSSTSSSSTTRTITSSATTDSSSSKYRYLYQKKVPKQYSNWSGWSKDKEYTSASNIVWGKQELVWNEKNGSKTTTTYKDVVGDAIFQETYDNKIGTYTDFVCSGYRYFIDETTKTIYKYKPAGNTNEGQAGWISKGTQRFYTVPTDDTTHHYKYLGMDYEACSGNCTLKPYYIYEVFTRSASTAEFTKVTKTTAQVSAECKISEEKIPVYGLKLTFVDYKVTRTQTSTTKYYYHTKTRTVIKNAYTSSVWSYSKNDKELIAQGYSYTGTREKIK